jgi:Spy/CpxP family protein refolding chaperone
MKRFLLVLLITVAVSLAGYFACYELATRHSQMMLAHPDCGMVWLRGEYHLSEAQYAKIAQMHDDYRPTCARMCQRIAEANRKVNALIAANPTVTPETEAALQQWALLQNECRVAMLRHVYAVSAEMNPQDGRRYIQMATARIVEPGGMAHASLLSK